MESLFFKCLNTSIILSWIIIVILLIRILFKKLSKQVCFLLWGIVGIKFYVPLSYESKLSLIPSTEVFNINDIYNRSFRIHSGISKLDTYINNIIGSHYYEGVTVPNGTMVVATKIFSIIWFIGVVVFCICFIINLLRMKSRLRTSIRSKENIWESDMITSSFVFGTFKPRIYVPFNIKKIEFDHIVAHERAHIKHGDHLWKLLAYFVLIINWYNPLIWIAYKKFIDDMELACDERVVKKLNISARKNYAETLLNCTIKKNTLILEDKLYFGQENIKDRVISVVNYKKKSNVTILFSIVLLIVIAICFLTNPENSNSYSIIDLLKIINN